MQLICHDCWNYAYFEVEVETLRELKTDMGQLVVRDARFEEFNYSQSMLRDNLDDIVKYVIKQNAAVLIYDSEKEEYLNNYIRCARCGSKKVTKPYSNYRSKMHGSIENEILEHHKEFNQLRRERRYADTLPVLPEKY